MKLDEFDFHLPAECIAQAPASPRDSSRLLVLHRAGGELEHRRFTDLTGYLAPGDVLVLNDTKVMPARLFGQREGSGARMEVLLLRRLQAGEAGESGEGGACSEGGGSDGGEEWETLVRPARKARPGTRIACGDGRLVVEVLAEAGFAGGRVVRLRHQGDLPAVLDQLGQMPLPPYIKAQPVDPGRYQTVYARAWGSAAAPTAGLHFTPQLLDRLQAAGVQVVYLTLHVGLGTFRPVQVEEITDHRMHAEFYQVTEEAAAAVNAARCAGRRVVAVGTTVVRTLESLAAADGRLSPGSGWTDLFIYPGYRFRAVDAMVTNFHLPRSTLLMLVSALAGRQAVLAAYAEAVRRGYRFYSFGDAMLII